MTTADWVGSLGVALLLLAFFLEGVWCLVALASLSRIGRSIG